jgi:apolipoprotein D and lipocalin family protein
MKARVLAVLLPALLLAGCATTTPRHLPPLSAPDAVDTGEMAGRWYVIANIPYFAERGRVAGRVEYRPRPDGRFDDLYTARRGGFDAPERTLAGLAWPLDPPANTRWRSRFYWPFTFDFQVLHLDAGAGHLLLAHPSRDYAWVMAREPRIAGGDYAALLARFAAEGYDVSRLLKVPQFPEQVGQPGFQ